MIIRQTKDIYLEYRQVKSAIEYWRPQIPIFELNKNANEYIWKLLLFILNSIDFEFE